MALTKKQSQKKLPARFSELVAVLPPRAVQDEEHHDEMIEMIDRLMTIGRLTKDQKQYLETLVQLVQAYETNTPSN